MWEGIKFFVAEIIDDIVETSQQLWKLKYFRIIPLIPLIFFHVFFHLPELTFINPF